jgi:hypothetical protein
MSARAKNPHGSKPRGWFKRCVAGVKRSGSAVDPNAVCGAIEARSKGNPSEAYRAGYAALKAGAARYGTVNLTPSIQQRDDWRGDWRQFMAGWNAAKKEKDNPSKSRFEKCVEDVEARGGAQDPNAVCASAGRKKYGAEEFQRMAAAGKRKAARRKNVVPLALAELGEGQFFAPTAARMQKKATSALKKLGFRPITFNRSNPRNPADSAADLFRGFHGRDSEFFVEVTTDVHEHTYLAALGELVSMEIISPTGAVIVLKGFETRLGEPAFLAASEKRTQLFIEGGDQSVNLKAFGIREPIHESEVLGELDKIEYYTVKDHLGDQGGEAVYRHKLKSKRFRRKPEVIYDTRNQLLSLSGGNYTIEDEGIVD